MPINRKKEPGILLDTHVWIWLMNGTPEFAAKMIQRINQAAENGRVFVSAISIWEVATLVAKRRLVLRTSVKEWIDAALSQPGVNLVPLLPDIAIESAQLPNGMHGDPADRILVATARLKQLVLLTRDTKILQYASHGYVQAKEV